jgi:predicted RNA-binding Zn-ribbon protein involved in translation (DUF1610 family)
MQFPFGSRSRDLDQLRQTLPHLGTSSTVPGIAAALSWNERRVERTVREWERLEPMRVAYDPLSRSVRLLGPTAAPAAPGVAATVTAPVVTAPSPPPAAVLPRAWGGGVNCRSCGTAMEPTGTGSGLFCPGCGRLASGHHATAPPPLPVAAPAPPKPAAAPGPAPSGAPAITTGTGHAVSDRKAQEMFAAWATAQPIPCPRCRVPLRHNGVGQYKCPCCGETARFVGEGGAPRVSTPPLAPPAA